MAHKKKHHAPVPPGNQQHGGPSLTPEQAVQQDQTSAEVSPQEQDPKQRIGDFNGTADHAFQQPGGHNDANH
jgi:hypothetical protein